MLGIDCVKSSPSRENMKRLTLGEGVFVPAYLAILLLTVGQPVLQAAGLISYLETGGKSGGRTNRGGRIVRSLSICKDV